MLEKSLEIKNISKRFMGVQALKNVSFNAYKGKVNVLIGENGAGKSTLMKILAGVIHKDSGEIYINGQLAKINTPLDAIHNKIAMIYQELNLVSHMTVQENIFLGRELKTGIFLNKAKLRKLTEELLEKYELDVKPDDVVGDLTVAKQQMLEIIKALSVDAQIIVMDEPTSSLTQQEVEHLFQMIKRLKEAGVTIIYISHRMEELFEIGDFITVLRDGELVGEWPIEEVTQESLINAMVGRTITQRFPKVVVPIGEEILRVRNLTKKGVYEDISFSVYAGEILGLSGLVGAGRTEIALSIFGDMHYDSGTIEINGKLLKPKDPSYVIKNSIAYLPEDRKRFGVVLDHKIRNNISITNMDKVTRYGWLDFKKEECLCNDAVDKLGIKAASILQNVSQLSGGNQQKVVIAKWITRDLKVLILDEPTRGVDIGAKEEIHKLIGELVKQGIGIILISSELPEILGMSDRILVIHEGRIKAELNAKEATQELIMSYSLGN